MKKDLEKERRELERIFKSVDRRVKKYGELTEEEIQREIEAYRRSKRKK